MASYGIIYEFSFDSQNGCDIDIFISKKNYTGERYKRAIGQAPILRREHSGSIFGTSLELYAECKVDGEFSQLYTSSADEYKVEVYRHQQLIWVGFVSPELYSEPDIAPPYDVQIIATDGLGELKNYEFHVEGMAAVGTMVANMVNHTGLDLDYLLASSLETYDGTYWSGKGGMLNLLLDLSYKNSESCYDVLQAILESFHAGIVQHNGQWLIFRESDMIGLTSESGLSVTDASGADKGRLPISAFGSIDKCQWWPVGQLSTVIEPAKRKVEFKAERHYKPTVFVNSDMTEDAGWEKTYNASYDPEEGAYILPDEGSNISQKIDFGVEVGYKLALHLSARNIGNSEEAQQLGVEILIDGRVGVAGQYYLHQLKSSDGSVRYAWAADEGYIYIDLPAPSDSDTEAEATSVDIVLPLYRNSSRSFAYASSVQVKMFNAEGKHDIYVYKCFLAQYEQRKGWEIEGNIGNGARESGDELDLTVIDGSLVEAGANIFGYGIPMSPDTEGILTSWRTGVHNESSYLSLMVKSYAQAVALPRSRYEGVLNIPSSSINFPTLFLRSAKYYFPETYSINLLNDEVRVSMTSIPAADVTITSEKVTEIKEVGGVTPAGGASSGGGSGGGGTADVVIDTEMSDTSENAVANKVIKAYVDEAVANAGAGAVIFDATSSTDPWNLNGDLQTKTTLAEMVEAINNGSPIYMRFGNGGLVSVGEAHVSTTGEVEMNVSLPDAEGSIVRNIHTWCLNTGQWYWEAFEEIYATEESVNRKISDVETTIEQLDKAIDDQISALASDIKANPATYLPLKTINGQSLYGAGDILISGGGSVTETKYNLRFSAYSSQTLYVSRGEKAEVKFSFISQVMYVGTSAFVDTGEAGIVTISVKRPSDSSYQPVKTMTVPSNAVQTVDIADYLGDGTNLVRISGEGETTGKTAENLAYTVIRSSLSIQTSFEWWKPHTADTITVPYYVGGTIDKILHLTVTGPNGYSRSYSQALGTTPYLESVASIVIDHPGASGVYTLSAYVASTDGNFRTSELAIQTIFVTAGASGTYMAVNNVAALATNYAENAFFDFAIYNGGSASASVKFNIEKDGSSVYSTTLGSVATGTRQTFSAPLEISTSDSSDFSVSISATSGGTGLITPVSVQVDNSYSFAAFPGAVFFMNPKTRDNSQSNRNYIINEIDGSAVAATWSGMNWGSDGYQTVGGVKVLRIFAGSSVSISYQPFKTEAARTGKTIELDLLIGNVVDYEDAVLGIVKTLTSSWLGVSLTPEKMTVFSSLMSDGENQSFKFEDRTRLRITLVVMPDAYGNSGFNLVVMYVNGTKNREFTYANTDSFANDGDIVIGSDSADIDTYAVRVYNKALSSGAVHQNHVNLLDSIEEKKAFRDKNDVLAANGIDIDIEKVKKRCNVVVFEGELPSLSNPNKFKNNWYIYWRDNPEWNCVIRNILQDGQGTSAKLYREWNQRGKADGDTVTTYADGSTTTGAFVFMPGKPKIKTFTWKLNWASSCQCNKMGSVNSINDLCTALGILDPDGNPTAIYQQPFVGVHLTYDDSGNPVRTFIGLFTGGPDKGDPYWFNYDYDRYPDLISVEGADNASAGALFRVPWNPSAGRWQFNMDEESMQYNGINAFDYNAGNYETKADIQAHYERVWKPVYDFVYQCSPNIEHFDGTLAQLNAQVSALKDNDLEYWLDGGGLYYYESALGQYIPSDSGSGQMNLYDQLVDKGYGVTSAMISGLSADAVNTYLKVARATKFRLEADRYFNVAQGRFAVNWNLVLGSTDTRAKNTYWTVRGLLSEGYRCTLFWDDTDTIGPFTNQGQDRKPYWAEVGDKYADGSPVWNGEQNRFYNLMELAFPDELADDMRSLLNAMVELGGMTTGNKSDQLYAFFHKYYFSQAQEYFPSALYNAAAKRLYENAKLVYGISYNNDTDPITQSLGDYYSGWKRWIKRRIQYIQSKYQWGDYSGASGDVISVRAAGQSISYQITPAIWMYPVIMNGTSPVRGERTEAGQVCNMTIDLGGAADQQNTIKGVHYLQDIGAWHDKQVHGTLSIYGRMLRELHIGHPTADIVITITKLILGETPSMRLIDLRRVSTLTGILDLSSCTHLQTLHAQGTSLTSVTFPNGGPLASVGFPATMQQVFLKNFPKLYNSGVDISECKAGVTDFMITECPNMKPLSLLSAVIAAQESQGAAHALIGVRVTGINETYSSSEILAQIAALTDGTYQGLTPDGIRDGGNAILEGKVSINAAAYQDEIDAIEDYFQGRLALTITGGFFIRFADAEVLRVLLANGVDTNNDGGIEVEEAEAVTNIGTWFKGNTAITTFNELEYFTGVTTIASRAFYGATNLKSINLLNVKTLANGANFKGATSLNFVVNMPNYVGAIPYGAFENTAISAIESLGAATVIQGNPDVNAGGYGNHAAFRGCTNLKYAKLPSTLTDIQYGAFAGCTQLATVIFDDKASITTLGIGAFIDVPAEIDVDFPNLTGTLGYGAFQNTGVQKVSNLGSVTIIGGTTDGRGPYGPYGSWGAFKNCTKLAEATLPQTVTTIQRQAFYGCTALQTLICEATTPPALSNVDAFTNTPIASEEGYIYVPDASVAAYQAATNWSTYASRIKPISQIDDTPETPTTAWTDITSQMENDKAYNTALSVGSTFTYGLVDSQWTVGYKTIVLDLANIGKVRVTGRGGNAPRLYCFIDANDKVLSVASAQQQASALELSIPASATKVIISFQPNYEMLLEVSYNE